jgi:hypothetical protein
MATKKRAPIEQLRAAGRIVKQMLTDRGIIAKKSVIDELMHVDGAPTLPGIPAYLPHQWTIKAAQQMMRDFLVIWIDQNRETQTRAQNITQFFTFVVSELRRQEHEYNKEISNMPKFIKSLKEVPVLKDVFSPMRKKETIGAIHRFFIDSFAVAIALCNSSTTSEYANWFLNWTQDLYALWVKPSERGSLKKK